MALWMLNWYNLLIGCILGHLVSSEKLCMIVAYLVRDTGPPNPPLSACLANVKNVGGDGYDDIHDVGLAGIKERMMQILDQSHIIWLIRREDFTKILGDVSKSVRSGFF